MRLVLRDITKRFGSMVANDRISLTVEPGEIHCLLGENGAGKSTLMNVLYGLYHADEGEIEIDGEVRRFTGPGDAMAAGIGMVHQHFMLIPVFTRRRERHARQRVDDRADRDPRPGRRSRAGHRDLRALRLPRRPRRPRRGPPGRRAAARRDHQGPQPRRRAPRLRRAHRGAHPAGDRRADGDHAPAQGQRARRSSSSPTSSARYARSPTGSRSSGSARSSARPSRPPPTPSSPR